MAFSSSIVIVFIGVAAYAVTAGPVQGVSNTVQRDEYGSPVLADLLARYYEDRSTNQRVKRSDDPDDYGYFLSEEQVRLLLDAGRAYLSQHPNSASDEQERDAVGRRKVSGRILNSPISSRVFVDSTNHPHRIDQNDDQENHHLSDQVTAHGRLVKNLDQFDDEYYVRNLDHIGGGHLVRNLDQIGGGHLVRDLDQIDDGHYVRNLDQIGGGHLVRNLDQIGGGHLLRNLDQIGGGHLVRNLNQIDAENLARRAAYASNAAAKRRSLSASADQPVAVSRILASGARGAGSRNLDGHLLRQARRGLDSLSGATFGENKRYAPLRRLGAMNVRPGNFDEIDRSVFDRFSKRNIDEIDTAFDSFFKRNFDEIDRVGWGGFVKRFNNYLADRQQR